jgi:hypothetical protein
MRISSVLGEDREAMGRHTFVGGNFLVLRMLNAHRDELGVTALPSELNAAVAATLRQLGADTATVEIPRIEHAGDVLEFDVAVTNVTGHKLPTAYPSRRAWIHLTVRDAAGAVVFESGRLAPSGAIVGNANDADASRFEPHDREISRPDEVQIYESIIAGPEGALTTGLLTATQYVKDNRLLPRGFDKATAEANVAVHGGASGDADFTGGSDHVRYAVGLGGAAGPFTVEAELLYQSIGFRWAWNLNAYDAVEPRRFVRWYDQMAADSAAPLATARATVP